VCSGFLGNQSQSAEKGHSGDGYALVELILCQDFATLEIAPDQPDSWVARNGERDALSKEREVELLLLSGNPRVTAQVSHFVERQQGFLPPAWIGCPFKDCLLNAVGRFPEGSSYAVGLVLPCHRSTMTPSVRY